jgi:hypothetical protein
MHYIEKLIDRIRAAEQSNRKDVIVPIDEAKAARDELTKFLLSTVNVNKSKEDVPDTEVTVKLVGKKW